MKKFYLPLTTVLAICVMVFAGCESSPELSDDSTILTGNEPPEEDCIVAHRTQTPGGWGAPAAGNNPGTIRDAYFDGAFPDGLTVGCTSGYTVHLTSAAAVEDFLPSGGKPKAIDQDYLDPDSKELKNSLAGHLVALTLSVHIDHYVEDFGAADFLLCDLRICSGEFAKTTVQQVLTQANKALGGCDSKLTVSEAYEIVSTINENFVDGTIDNGYLCCKKDLTNS